MAPKKKKGGKAAAKAANEEEEEDWDAVLNEAAAEAAAAAAAPGEASEAPSAPEEEAAATTVEGGGGGKKKDKKKKRGKKDKGDDEEAAPKPQSARGKLIAERLAAQKAEEERVRKIKEEQERKIREEEEARLKAEAEAKERRDAKLARRAEKKAEAKLKGTYETKKQREARLAAERRLKSMQDAGMLPVSRVAPKEPRSTKEEEEDPEEEEEEEEEAPPDEKAAAEPEEPDEKGSAKVVEQPAEEDAGGDWEDAADDWEDAADDTGRHEPRSASSRRSRKAIGGAKEMMHGLEQQTLESISMLKRKRTPFVVALNKIDRCYDWKGAENACVRRSLATQRDNTMQEFRGRLEQCSRELNEQGLNVALYWENEDPRSTVSIVPTSAITGEGVPDLLRVILSLTQQRLTKALMLSSTLQCTVLEVKVVEGLGATLDVILVNGTLREGDTLVLCAQDGALVTQARALLTPPPSRETRVKSELIKHDVVQAAIGLKITGQGLEKVVPGTSLLVSGPDDDLEDLKEEVVKDVSGLVDTLVTEARGVSVQASTLGALEALLEFLRNPGKDRSGKERQPIPVFAASVGPVYKKDVIRAGLMQQKGHDEFACILGFDVPVDPEAQAHADKIGVRVFTAEIIYHLETSFTRHLDETMDRKRAQAQEVAVFPCLVKILPKHIFNAKDPIVVGVEVVDGILKVGTPLCIPHNNFLDVGVVQSIQSNHKEVERVKKGSECAIKIANPNNPTLTYGRQFDATHALYSKLSRESIDQLKQYFKDDLSNDDWRLVIKLKKVFSII
ncbi:hypothetical protein CTAYLR_008239 [Chrysophaeum taylorii]|uniref:Eukaryotic translation initiation factor 5B n=1 Tax=Chrysophaeum taylorii TaxID=2483200 RepID=A0AAD7XMZ7_9STRA|nr:hypothetical protein CTAYLR_008239 [Chrysophaeum taylorii]